MTPERKKKIENVLDRRQHGMVVVLENVSDPHNISAVMRSCDATGVQDIYILNTQIPKHDYFSEQSSASARKWVTVHHFSDIARCTEHLRSRGYKLLSSYLGETESTSLYDISLVEDVALIFGNEKEGISDELLQYSDQNFVIPQVGMVQSLNISVACAVSLYEGLRQRQAAGLYEERSLEAERYATLEQQWCDNKKSKRRTSKST